MILNKVRDRSMMITKPKKGLLSSLKQVLLFFSMWCFISCTAKAEPPLVEQHQYQADRLTEQIPFSEILGPLAPLSLSPFFGLTCLSGMSILQSHDLLPHNRFLETNPALANPAICITFLVLTLLTSLPRLTKVSKGFAQATDHLETYATMIIYGVLIFMSGGNETTSADTLVHAGFFSTSVELALAIAATINILVIQTIRFVMELMIWISPIPFIDALFETLNKTVCAGLMALYAYSPFAGLVVNIALFLLCLFFFKAARRKIRYLQKHMITPAKEKIKQILFRNQNQQPHA